MKKAALVLWVLSGALWCSGCSLVLWVLSGALGALVSLVLSGCSLVLFGALWCSRGSGCFLGLSGALWVLSSLSGPMCGCASRAKRASTPLSTKQRFDRQDPHFHSDPSYRASRSMIVRFFLGVDSHSGEASKNDKTRGPKRGPRQRATARPK